MEPPLFKGAESILALLTTTANQLKKANGQETNPTERAKPIEQGTHTSSGFPALGYHLRRFFRHFVPLHDFVNVVDAPRNPLAQDWLWRVLAHCPRLPFESSLWSATIPRRGLLAGLSGKPTPNIGRMRADWHGSWRRSLCFASHPPNIGDSAVQLGFQPGFVARRNPFEVRHPGRARFDDLLEVFQPLFAPGMRPVELDRLASVGQGNSAALPGRHDLLSSGVRQAVREGIHCRITVGVEYTKAHRVARGADFDARPASEQENLGHIYNAKAGSKTAKF